MKREWTPLLAALAHSEKFADLPDDTARCFYPLLLLQVDLWGRIDARPRTLNAIVWPMLGKDAAITQRCIEDCARVGLLEVHERDGARWIQIPDWDAKAAKILRLERRGTAAWPEPSRATLILGVAVHSTGLRSTPQDCGELRKDALGMVRYGEEREDARGRATHPPTQSEQEPEREPDPGPAIDLPAPIPRAHTPSEPDWSQPLAMCLGFDTTAVRKALAEWDEHCSAKGKSVGATQWRKLVPRWAPVGAERFVAAVDHSIASGWSSLHEPKPDETPRRRTEAAPSGDRSAETAAYLANLRAVPRGKPPKPLSEMLADEKRKANTAVGA